MSVSSESDISQTTAHTLCFTFGMLALYQDEQDKLYEHIKSVIPDGSIPVSALRVCIGLIQLHLTTRLRMYRATRR